MFNSAATWEGQASRSSCSPLLHLPPSPSPLFHLSFLSSSVRLSVLTLPIHHISSNMARTNVTKWYRTHFQVTSTRFRSALPLFSSLLFASLLSLLSIQLLWSDEHYQHHDHYYLHSHTHLQAPQIRLPPHCVRMPRLSLHERQEESMRGR